MDYEDLSQPVKTRVAFDIFSKVRLWMPDKYQPSQLEFGDILQVATRTIQNFEAKLREQLRPGRVKMIEEWGARAQARATAEGDPLPQHEIKIMNKFILEVEEGKHKALFSTAKDTARRT